MPLFQLCFSVSSSTFLALFFLSAFMDSSNNPNSTNNKKKSSTPNTTFIQADPENFKALVHKYTGLPQERLPPRKNPSTAPPRPAGKSTSGEIGPRKPAFKLHERRQSARNLEIDLNIGGFGSDHVSPLSSVSARQRGSLGYLAEKVMVSPVSPLELLARGSPRTPSAPSPPSSSSAPMDEEMRGIYEKGYYIYPDSATPIGTQPPKLLDLFPIDTPIRVRVDDEYSSTGS